MKRIVVKYCVLLYPDNDTVYNEDGSVTGGSFDPNQAVVVYEGTEEECKEYCKSACAPVGYHLELGSVEWTLRGLNEDGRL